MRNPKAKKKNKTKASNSLKISVSGKKPLTKQQKKFNQLTKRIQKLEKELVTNREKYHTIFTYYSNEVQPKKVRSCKLKLELATIIDQNAAKFKFTNSELDLIQSGIVLLCDQAFTEVIPSEEEKKLYDRWSEISFDEVSETQNALSLQFAAELFKEATGRDLDLSGIDANADPETVQRIIFEQLHGQADEEQAEASEQSQKKSKKQLVAEQTEEKKDQEKNKSIRNIYIALAKLLHPDTAINEEERIEKEALMKQVTTAYKAKDFSALLKLEIEWVHKTSEHIDELANDKLSMYIEILKEQEAELELELEMQAMNPIYSDVSESFDLPLFQAMEQLQNIVRQLDFQKESLDLTLDYVQGRGAKKHTLEFVTGLEDERQNAELYGYDSFMFDDDDDDDYDYDDDDDDDDDDEFS